MIQNLYITNPVGSTLQLNLRSSLDDHGLLIFNLTGLGSPKATVSGLSGPTYDGVRGQFVRTDARHLLLTIAIPVRGGAEDVARAKVYEFFPVKEEVIFRVETDTEDVSTTAVVESVEMNHMAKVVNAVISLYCPDPYFYDVLDVYTYGFYAGASRTIAYTGASPTGGLFTIYCGESWSWEGGPALGELIISNDLNDQTMIIFFISFSIGDQYIIDSRIGRKRVTHVAKATGVETDVTGDVSPTSEWIRLYNGNNNINITIDGVYQGPSPGRPSAASLKVFLPMNEAPSGDPLEIEGGLAFNEVGAPVMAAPTTGTMKVYPHARVFVPGDGGHLESVAAHSILSPTDTFSMAIWLKAKAYPSSGFVTVVEAMDAGNNGIRIEHSNTGSITMTMYSDGGTVISFRNWGSLNSWALFFIWYTGGVNNQMYITYNALTSGSGYSSSHPDPYSSGWDIGGRSNGTKIFDGSIGPIAFYDDYILSTSHRAWLYNSGKGRTYAELTLGEEVGVVYKKRHTGV
jgi:hypothetical protein